MALGAGSVTPWQMARAISVFANGGYRVVPYAFTQVMTSKGDVIYDRRKDAPAPERVLELLQRRVLA